MAQATLVPPPLTAAEHFIAQPTRARAKRPEATLRFESLVLTEPRSLAKGRGTTLLLSGFLHSILIAAVIVVPLFFYDSLPAPDEGVHAFFVTPAVAAPPPPPPAAGARAAPRTPVFPHPEEPARFVAPIETPTELRPEEGISLVGVEGGVPGGVEGGVPGGVMGGIVGGLPHEAPPPPRAVRVGGHIKAPQLMKKVDPVYPVLAKEARVSALIILETTVDTTGRVRDVTILRGAPLFDEVVIDAVRQWVYRPLLLNGVPTPFVLTVTLKFSIKATTATAGS